MNSEIDLDEAIFELNYEKTKLEFLRDTITIKKLIEVAEKYQEKLDELILLYQKIAASDLELTPELKYLVENSKESIKSYKLNQIKYLQNKNVLMLESQLDVLEKELNNLSSK